jgi:hypothetical protein
MSYAEQATKSFTKAKPTVNADEKVVKWELELEYSLNGYTVNFPAEIELEGNLKKPEKFTVSELKELARESHLDAVYNSMYESTQVPGEPSEESVVEDFDISSLKP